jgi:hypothetical protein
VRKVRAAAIETGLDHRIELVPFETPAAPAPQDDASLLQFKMYLVSRSDPEDRLSISAGRAADRPPRARRRL